ncbi:hypothetical protein HDU80_006387 [Chytriomyces hyalinus]|nr:hypothetical protein HDU80_006387 [Chytriomyces hyalinus]
MLHFATNSHHLSLKINTLEVWCYQCVKWVGKRGKSQAELERVESIIALFSATATPHSTNTPRISPTILSLQRHKLYNDRRHLERDILVVAREDWEYVGCPEGLPNGLPLMNPYMAPFHDFGIVSEASWIILCKYYGGGPALSEENIPRDNPVYFPLLSEIALGKKRIIEQCKSRKYAASIEAGGS